MAVVEAGQTNGLDGTVGTKDGMANGQNGSVQLKDGTAAVKGTATDGTERSAAKESELSVNSSQEGRSWVCLFVGWLLHVTATC